MIQSAIDLAERCAKEYLRIVDEHATSSAVQAALLLLYTDPGSPTEPVTAQAFNVLEAERDALLKRLPWTELWLPDEYTNALDGRYILQELAHERRAVTIELHEAGIPNRDEVFWTDVARRLNNGPRPRYASRDWCAAAIDYGGGDWRTQIQRCIPADVFHRLEAAGYIGPPRP